MMLRLLRELLHMLLGLLWLSWRRLLPRRLHKLLHMSLGLLWRWPKWLCLLLAAAGSDGADY